MNTPAAGVSMTRPPSPADTLANDTMKQRSNDSWKDALGGSDVGRDAALEDLRAYLLGALRRALSPRADDALIEDMVQDSLLRILESLDQFQGRSRFLTWATSIAVHAAMSELRRRRWKDVSIDDVLAGSVVPTPGFEEEAGPDAAWTRRAMIARMYDAMENELTQRQRTALIAEIRGMPQDEIARRLGSNRNAVYKLTHDARKRLRRALESAGYGPGDVRLAMAG